MKQATQYANAIAQIENDNALDAVKKSSEPRFYPTDKERAEWVKTLQPVQKKWKVGLVKI